MSISDFNGDTFVCYIDISGFKDMMKRNIAKNSMNKFYKTAYLELLDSDGIQGLFISDCGIMFINKINPNEDDFLEFLEIIKRINLEMLKENIMLTTSIAYGKFYYEQRKEHNNIEKNGIYGDAYVTAFLDNENGKPKMLPGECRILIENIPFDLSTKIQEMDLIKKENSKHFYYYWHSKNKECIDTFKSRYHSVRKIVYENYLRLLKESAEIE